MKYLLLVILTLAALFTHPIAKAAQALKADVSATLSYGHRLSFYSPILGEKRVMNVYLPENFNEVSNEHRYPLIFLSGIHGDQFFLTMSGIVRHLASLERMPQSIIISLHEGNEFAPNVYTNGMWDRDMLQFDADTNKYVKHLKEELLPYFTKHYRAADHRMIVGVSGSSVFPLHALAKEPGLFQAHFFLAAADMMGMGYQPNQTFSGEIVKSFKQQPNRKGHLYFATAQDDLMESPKLRALMSDAITRLSPLQSADFKFKAEVIANEGHYDAYIKAMLSGIELVYPKKDWSINYRELIKQPGDAMANIDAAYQKLSARYGFDILPLAKRWNNVNNLDFIGRKLLKDGRIKESVTVMRRWVKYHPKSVAALQGLANALAADNQKDAAQQARNQAENLK